MERERHVRSRSMIGRKHGHAAPTELLKSRPRHVLRLQDSCRRAPRGHATQRDASIHIGDRTATRRHSASTVSL